MLLTGIADMMGEKQREFTPQVVSLETLVPQDNFYRKLEAEVDLSFVRELVRDFYATKLGRPSIDPVVFFKLQLIMYFEGIRSERQLMEMAAMRLDHRFYLGYDLNERVPDHSSLTHIRDRYGLEVFQQFFEQIVELCIKAGLVWGKELHFDGTLAEANADYDKLVPRFYWEAKNHLQALFPEEADVPTETEALSSMRTPINDRHFVHKYAGQQRLVKANSYQRQRDYWVNPTDPDASPMGKFKMGYRTQYVVDGGKARIIVACLVTPTTIQDNTPMLDLAWWSRFRWHLPFKVAVGDRKYGTIANIVGLENNGIKAYTPIHAETSGRKKKGFPREAFTYDAERDGYICPRGEILPHRRADDRTQTHAYYADRKTCGPCPIKPQCTTNKRWRFISHSYFKSYLDRVVGYQQTEAYQKAMRKRQVWPEPRFAESKMWHQGQRFRLRRIHKVNIEALLRASVQNLKQLLRYRKQPNPLKPGHVPAFALPVPHFSSVSPDFRPLGACFLSFTIGAGLFSLN
jgi:transposase